MVRLSLSIASLLSGVGLVLLANGMLTTGMSLSLKQQGANSLGMALVLAGYYVGMTVGAILGARLIRQFGHIRVFAGFAALLCLATMGLGGWRHLGGWFGLRCVIGFGAAGQYMVIESWLNERSTPQTRGTLLALYMIVAQMSLAAGQLWLSQLSIGRFEFFALVAGLYCASVLPIAFTRLPQPPPPPARSRMGLLRLLRVAPVGVVGGFLAGIVSGALHTLGPLFALDLQNSTQEAAWFMSAILVGGLLMQWPIGRLSDRFGRFTVLNLNTASFVLCSLGLAWLSPQNTWLLLLAGGCLGAFGFVFYPLAISIANDRVQTEDMVAVSGTMTLIYGVGAILGPMVGTWMMKTLGARGLLYWIGASAGLSLVYFVFRMKQAPPVAAHDQGVYMPITLPTALATHQLDPRVEPAQLSLDLSAPPTPSKSEPPR